MSSSVAVAVVVSGVPIVVSVPGVPLSPLVVSLGSIDLLFWGGSFIVIVVVSF